MMNAAEYGKKGEDLTADYLRRHGYFIFKRNYHSRFGEIDLIAERDDLLLFVEVKTRRFGAMVEPAQAVDRAKQERLYLTALDFIKKTKYDYDYRFDVCEITVLPDETFSLNYVKDAFRPH